MYLNATSIFKCLCYSRGIGQVTDTIIQVQDKNEKLGVRAWMYTRPGGSDFESSASFQWIENETKRLPRPSFGEVFFSIILMAN